MPTDLLSPSWTVTQHGASILIDPYDQFPTETVVSLDLETTGGEPGDPGWKIVCIGICGDGKTAKVFFDIRPELIEYLRKTQFVCHNGKGAEIPWLNKAYGGFKIEQLYFDTKTGAYALDSTRKNYSLKPLLKSVFGVEYPTYSEIIHDPALIGAACSADPSLYITRTIGVTKKRPEGVVQQKLPRQVLLDRMPKEIVAEYNACDIVYTYRLWKWLEQRYDARQRTFFNTIEMPMTRLIYQMEQLGIKIDTQAVRRIHHDNSRKRRVAKNKIYEMAGESFNLNSPKQLLPILQRNGIDASSTGEDALVQYQHSPLVQDLLEYRSHQKLCSTYTTPLYFNAIKATDYRIHARFSQNTITGRLSSSDPINLQNQPPEVRGCFVAKFGYCFVNADWSNIELRLPAHFSGEPKFVEELSREGGDLHTTTANFVYGGDVRSLPEAEYKKRRKVAKTCNFLLTNSGTPNRLKVELQCSEEEAQSIYTKFWEGYPVLAAWLKAEKKQARQAGGIGTYYGRWVAIPQLKLGCSGASWCGKVKGRDGRIMQCKECWVREEAERSAMSVKVQGTASDLNKLAALRLYREYGLVPVLNVHDELMYECPIEKAEETAQRVKYVMEHVARLRVPLIADVGIGPNWKLAKE